MKQKPFADPIEHLGEFGLIRKIKDWAEGKKQKGVVMGIGDDCAVLPLSRNRYQLLCVDTVVEGVDFQSVKTPPEAIGWKALAINLSDMAAMGGTPKAALVSLILPKKTSVRFVRGFYSGLLRLANRFHVSIVGGDLSSGREFSATVALTGESEKKYTVFRKGAKAGDYVCVTGRLGGSILGKHLNFSPRVREGAFIARSGASSMIDLSDGLGQDFQHLMEHSQTGFLIDERKVPVARAARKLARGNEKKALIHAFSDGEDFELLFTLSPMKWNAFRRKWVRTFRTQVTVIGQVVKWKGLSSASVPRGGFSHF